MEALPHLESNAEKIWEKLEEFYSSNFFDDCIFKKYGYLFDENTEERF
jgi:hypothetical protein